MDKAQKIFLFFSLLLCGTSFVRADPLVNILPPEKEKTFLINDAKTEISHFLELINNYRAQNNRVRLEIDYTLQQAAQWMSEDMASNNYHSHTDSLGRNPFKRMNDFGYTANTYKGENIAAGYSTAETVITGWQNSPGHNSNMLNNNFIVIGIGLAYNSRSNYGWYWTTKFGGLQTTPNPLSVPTPTAYAKDFPLTAYPNPAKETVTFLWRDTNSKADHIILWNVAGEQVSIIKNPPPNQTHVLWDTSTLAPGIYFYKVILTLPDNSLIKKTGKIMIIK